MFCMGIKKKFDQETQVLVEGQKKDSGERKRI